MNFAFKNKDQKLQQPVNYTPGKRHLAKIYWYILLLALLAPFAYLGFKIFSNTFLMNATGHIVFGEITLRSPAKAYVNKILIVPGGAFKKEQEIVHLSSPQLMSEIHSCKEEIKTLKSLQQKFYLDTTELAQLLNTQKYIATYIVECNVYLSTMKNLRSRGLSTIIDTEKARYDLNEAILTDKTNSSLIATLKVDKKIESEKVFGEKIRNEISKLKILDTSLHLLTITAPEDGTLAELLVHETEYVKDGQDIAILVIRGRAYIEAYIESRFISEKLKAGHAVTIVFPDGSRIPGTVLSTPVFAKGDPSKSNLIQSDKKKILIQVLPKKEIPEKYRIAGLPVDIHFY